MYTNNVTQHPDEHLHRTQVKAITHGGMQAADTAAMEAMYEAIEHGANKEEYEKIFFDTYNKVRNGK